MRKAGLLDKKPLTATAKMLDMAAKDNGTRKEARNGYYKYSYTEYESRYYFRAQKSAIEDILEVDLFTRKDLRIKRLEPRFRIFLDYDNYDFITWNVMEGRWSKAKIDMLDTDDSRYSYSYRGRNYASQETINTVNRYLKTGSAQDVEVAVIDFQAKVRGDELSKKHKLITDMIDAYMDTVPEKLPSDWMRFINNTALEPGHAVFYKKGEKLGYCTRCRLHVTVPEEARHNITGRCSNCGSSITYKSWGKQKSIRYDTAVSLIQKCTDGQNYVYRQFDVCMRAWRENDYLPEISIEENYRRIFWWGSGYNTIINVGEYEMGEFRHTGIIRWCESGSINHGYGWYSDYGYSRSVLYTGNLKRLLQDTQLKYVPAAEIFRSLKGKRLNVMSVIGDMKYKFPYEAFWKIGLRQFVKDRVLHDGTTGVARTNSEFKKPWQYLMISREDFKQAVRLDADDNLIRILQLLREIGVSITDEQLVWIRRYIGIHHILKYFDMQTPHKIIRYLKEAVHIEDSGINTKDNITLHLWSDYLDAARQLEWDLRDRALFFPQNIQRAHDEAVNVLTIKKDKEDAQSMKEKDSIMHKNAKEIKKAFCYKDKQYMIKVPGCYLDFKREGNSQHNCVATYYEKALKRKCIILFLRKRESPNEPFCTVEIQNNRGKFKIVQNRIAYNKDAPEEAKEFLRKAVAEAQKIADKMVKQEKEKIRVMVAV